MRSAMLYHARAVADGVHQVTLAKLMGHKDGAMIHKHYDHPEPGTLRKAAAQAREGTES